QYQNEVYVVTYNSGVFKIVGEKLQQSLVKVNDHKYIYSVLVDNDSIYSSNKGFFTKNPLAEYTVKDSMPSKKLGKSIIWDYVKTNDRKIFAAAWGIYDSNGGIYEIVNNKMSSRAS